MCIPYGVKEESLEDVRAEREVWDKSQCLYYMYASAVDPARPLHRPLHLHGILGNLEIPAIYHELTEFWEKTWRHFFYAGIIAPPNFLLRGQTFGPVDPETNFITLLRYDPETQQRVVEHEVVSNADLTFDLVKNLLDEGLRRHRLQAFYVGVQDISDYLHSVPEVPQPVVEGSFNGSTVVGCNIGSPGATIVTGDINVGRRS